MRTMRFQSFGALKGAGVTVGLIALWIGSGYGVHLWNCLSGTNQWIVVLVSVLIALAWLFRWAFRR